VANLSPYFEVVLIENTIFSVEFPVDPFDSKIKIKFLCKSKGYIYVYLSSSSVNGQCDHAFRL
jgi:hypothetical protein